MSSLRTIIHLDLDACFCAVEEQRDSSLRGRGYAQAVVSFVTAAILNAGKRATRSAAADNSAMQRVAERIGLQRER